MESEGQNLRETQTKRRQDWLIPYQNPLSDRLGHRFFASIPQTPGVYFMLNRHERLLYVGKAKNLRARLLSYRRAKPGQVSRKVIRLIHLVHEIRWEECVDEEAALLRENELLRTHQPPMNVMNVRPESYLFLALGRSRRGLELRLTHQDGAEEGELLFGAFKGKGRVRRGYSALIRLIWFASHEPTSSRYEVPGELMRLNPPLRYRFRQVQDSWPGLVGDFLGGKSLELLHQLTASLLLREEIPPFWNHVIQEDIQALQEFYRFGPERNYTLFREFGLDSAFIPQRKVDDLLVRLNQNR